MCRDGPAPMAEMARTAIREREVRRRPGTCWLYCNLVQGQLRCEVQGQAFTPWTGPAAGTGVSSWTSRALAAPSLDALWLAGSLQLPVKDLAHHRDKE